MRTFVLVTLMLLLSLALLAGFVLTAASAQTPPVAPQAATLAVSCGPLDLPSGVDTYVFCEYTATNTGLYPLKGLQLAFTPSTEPIPDAYYFLSGTRDGKPMDVAETQLSYDFGVIDRGQTGAMTLGIILRSTHRWGATTSLLGDGRVLDSKTELHDVTDAEAPTLRVSFRPFRNESAEMRMDSRTDGFQVSVENLSDRALDDVRIDLILGRDATLLPYDAVEVLANGLAVARLPRLEPYTIYGIRLPFAPNAGATCGYVHPATTVVWSNGFVVSKISESSISVGNCSGQGGGGGEPATLVDAGSGPDATGGHGLELAAALAWLAGCVLVRAGLAARRRV